MALGAALLAAPRDAWAGNDEGMLLGNEATLTAGAVTASTREGASLWYNPAGLAAAPNGSIELTGNVLQVRHYLLPDALRAGPRAVAAEATEVLAVPNAEVYVQRLSARVQLGVGVFVPAQHDAAWQATLEGEDGARWRLDRTTRLDTLSLGAGVGFAVSPRLRLGVSVFVTHQSDTEVAQLFAGPAGTASGVPFDVRAVTVQAETWGVELGAGVQWQPLPALALGLALRSPSLSVASQREARGVSANAPASRFAPMEEGPREDAAVWEAPLRVRFGAALTLARVSVAVDGDLALPTLDGALRPRGAQWNLRVGTRVRLGEALRVGVGLFTDRAAARAGVAPSAPVMDFYGGVLGIEFGETHRLRDERPDRLSFVTAIGLRYAWGSGEVDGWDVPTRGVDAPRATRGRIEAHEIGLNVTSSVRF